MFHSDRADACFMPHLVETRWTRFGHDRVYLKTADGAQIGYVDLKSGSVTVENKSVLSPAFQQLVGALMRPEGLIRPSR